MTFLCKSLIILNFNTFFWIKILKKNTNESVSPDLVGFTQSQFHPEYLL